MDTGREGYLAQLSPGNQMLTQAACMLLATTNSPVVAPIAAVVAAYQAAMEARSIEKLAMVFDTDLVVLEGTHKNVNWVDYRDNHIGPEMREWSDFKVLETRITDSVTGARFAYVVVESKYRITSEDNAVVVAAAETLMLKMSAGPWRIRHLHYSGKKVEPTPPGTGKP